jgi:hypothetical protein
MRRQDSSLVQENTITSLLCCVSFIATKDNLQDRHFDAPVFERFGTLLPDDWLCRNYVDVRPDTVTICSTRTAIQYTFQEPRQRHSDQGRSRSLVPQSGTICLPDWKILLWAKTLSENYLKHIYLIDEHYICAFAVYINLRREMFIMNEWMKKKDAKEKVKKIILIVLFLLNPASCIKFGQSGGL